MSAVLNDAQPQSSDHHETVVAESKVPMWIQDIIEKFFKVKKKKSTIEVRF